MAGIAVEAVASKERVIGELAQAIEAGRPVVLATIVETSRSVPRHAGTKMLVFANGETQGTVGGGALEAAVIAEAQMMYGKRQPRMLEYDLVNPTDGDPGICGGTVTIYLEPYMSPHTVYVVGCGHVGRQVVDLAHWIGYRTIAIDDREEYTTEAALPLADVRFCGNVQAAIAAHPVDADSSFVIVTRSPELDATLLPVVLDTPARYIGVMGSKTRWSATRDRVVAVGTDPEQLERVHTPIGLDVSAETLEEIAVSIMSEVIKVNRSNSAQT